MIKLYNQYSDYVYEECPIYATNILNRREIEKLGNPRRILRGGLTKVNTFLDQSGLYFIGPKSKCGDNVFVQDNAVVLGKSSITGDVHIADNSIIINSNINVRRPSKLNIMGYTNLKNVVISCGTATTLYNTNICCDVKKFDSDCTIVLIINDTVPILDININDNNYFEYVKLFNVHKKPYGAWVDVPKHNYCVLKVDGTTNGITILLDDLIKYL